MISTVELAGAEVIDELANELDELTSGVDELANSMDEPLSGVVELANDIELDEAVLFATLLLFVLVNGSFVLLNTADVAVVLIGADVIGALVELLKTVKLAVVLTGVDVTGTLVLLNAGEEVPFNAPWSVASLVLELANRVLDGATVLFIAVVEAGIGVVVLTVGTAVEVILTNGVDIAVVELTSKIQCKMLVDDVTKTGSAVAKDARLNNPRFITTGAGVDVITICETLQDVL